MLSSRLAKAAAVVPFAALALSACAGSKSSVSPSTVVIVTAGVPYTAASLVPLMKLAKQMGGKDVDCQHELVKEKADSATFPAGEDAYVQACEDARTEG